MSNLCSNVTRAGGRGDCEGKRPAPRQKNMANSGGGTRGARRARGCGLRTYRFGNAVASGNLPLGIFTLYTLNAVERYIVYLVLLKAYPSEQRSSHAHSVVPPAVSLRQRGPHPEPRPLHPPELQPPPVSQAPEPQSLPPPEPQLLPPPEPQPPHLHLPGSSSGRGSPCRPPGGSGGRLGSAPAAGSGRPSPWRARRWRAPPAA